MLAFDEHQSTEQQVDHERLARVAAHMPGAGWIALVVSVVGAGLLWEQFSALTWLVWGGGLAIISGIQTMIGHRMRIEPSRYSPRTWEQIVTVVAVAQGALWGVGGMTGVGHDWWSAAVIVSGLGGLVTLAVAWVAPSMRCVRVYVVIPVGLTVVGLLVDGSAETMGLAIVLLLLGIGLIRGAQRRRSAMVNRKQAARRYADEAAATAREPRVRMRERHPPTEPTASPQRRILVVDDELLVRRCLERALGDHAVVSVEDGRQALAMLEQQPFDVIVCDLMMAGMDGIQMYRELKRRCAPLAQRVIFVTGGAYTPQAQRFIDRVPNATLGKPFDMQKLHELVVAMPRTSATSGELVAPSLDSGLAQHDPSPLNVDLDLGSRSQAAP